MNKKPQPASEQHTKSTVVAIVVLSVLVMGCRLALGQQWTTAGNDIYSANTGNIGIGTTGPSAKLHVSNSSGRVSLELTSGGTNQGFINYVDGSQYLSFGNGNSTTDSLVIQNGGNVGIGTTVPIYPLEVAGPNGTGIRFNENTNGVQNFIGGYQSVGITGTLNNFPMALWTNGQERVRVSTSGNVGIGTTPVGITSLAYPLEVAGPNGTGIRFTETTNGVQNFLGAYQSIGIAGTLNNFPLTLWTNNAERARIDTSGNIGIGTASPSTRLHVVGDVTVTGNVAASGNISAKYQDIAEWVPARQVMAPGTVVVVDPNTPNFVDASSVAYDTRVAGIVSSEPGIVLGEASQGKVKVATTGRVKVRVDATLSSIRLGDLLVTSDKKGTAMRSEAVEFAGIHIHRPGTLIGKALEPLDQGEGEILVLLSLQ